jgi:methyltransferase-like protein
VVTHPGERPKVTPLTRLEAQHGEEVTNLYHDVISLEPFDRRLVQLLDGRHDRRALEEMMAAAVTAGEVPYAGDDGRAASLAGLAADIEQRLNWFAQVALLVE